MTDAIHKADHALALCAVTPSVRSVNVSEWATVQDCLYDLLPQELDDVPDNTVDPIINRQAVVDAIHD